MLLRTQTRKPTHAPIIRRNFFAGSRHAYAVVQAAQGVEVDADDSVAEVRFDLAAVLVIEDRANFADGARP